MSALASMRIAFLSTSLVKYTSHLANALAHNHSVAFVALDYQQDTAPGEPFPVMARRFFSPETTVYIAARDWVKRDPRHAVTITRAVRFLHEWCPDIIHVQRDFDYRVFLTLVGMAHVPYVVTVHDVIPHLGEERVYVRKPDWWMRHPVRMRARRLIVHAESIRRQLVSRHMYARQKTVVVPMQTYDTYRALGNLNVRMNRFEVLMFGRMFAYKGLDLLLDAVPAIAARVPRVKFTVAGTGPEIRRLSDRMRDRDRFEVHTGYVSDTAAADLFRRSALVVAPYHEASQSAVVAHAYAMGRPVVATAVGGLPEFVRDGRSGLLVPPKDPEALADAVVRVLCEDGLQAKLAAGAAALAASDFSPRCVARQLVDIYNSVLDGVEVGH